jgi:hypothetical protein
MPYMGPCSLCTRVTAFVLLVLILSSNATSGESKDRKGDEFALRLDQLRRTPNVQGGKVFRDQVVEQYKALIDEFRNDPRVAEAMLDVASRLQNGWPELNFFPKHAEAVAWVRKAAETAAPGSKVWNTAQFSLAGELSWSDTREARRILQQISDQARGHSLTLAQVEDELKIIAMHEGDLDMAEQHCRRVLNWYKGDRKRVPTDNEEKRELDCIILGSGLPLLHAFLKAPWPREMRERRIRALVNDHFWVQSLQRDGDDVLERLARPDYADSV